jgi:hypothetical protein
MRKTTSAKDVQLLEIQEIEMVQISFCVLGMSPLIMNRFNQKAWHELLLPSQRKNQAELEQNLKHDMVAEFRGAVYRNRDDKAPAAIHIPNGAFHACLASAALDTAGATKAKIERLTRVAEVNINLFGLPQLFAAMVRNSDMNRTPDVRTRPLFNEWACRLTIRYVKKILSERTVANLLGAAGLIVGIGDWRGQKGGPYGAFRLVDEHNADFKRIIKTQGRVPQLKALETPVCADEDTEELLLWFNQEVARREQQLPSQPARARRVIIERGGNAGNGAEYVGVSEA